MAGGLIYIRVAFSHSIDISKPFLFKILYVVTREAICRLFPVTTRPVHTLLCKTPQAAVNLIDCAIDKVKLSKCNLRGSGLVVTGAPTLQN